MSSIKHQTVDGYISEMANERGVSPFQAIQTAMAKEFIKYAKERDSAVYREKKGD